jgi:uncharacterized protein YndB with AHSA1/START domain
MNESRFVYVTYIRTRLEPLWRALTTPEWQRRYWFGMTQNCDWQVGSPWQLTFSDGRVADAGEVLEIDPPRRLVLRWRNEWRPEFHAEGDARATFTLEQTGEAVRLMVVHEMDRPDSQFIGAVSGGWPRIFSSLKSLLETGEPLPELPK